MPLRTITALSRALLANWTTNAHSHAGSLGSASVCRDPACLAREHSSR